MIRINLLPVKTARRRLEGQRQLLMGGVVVLVAFTGLVIFHGWAAGGIDEKRAEVGRVQAELAKLKTELGDYEDIRRQRDDLRRQKEAIVKLQTARIGPVYLMRELSDILSRGKGPTFNKERYEEALRRDPNSGLNGAWEPKRVWLMSYTEKGGVVEIHGGAKSDEDVAEFLKRLKLSAFFSDVYWKQTQPQSDSKNPSLSFVIFDVTARVSY